MHHHRLVSADTAKRKTNYKCPFCHRPVIIHQTTVNRRSFFVHAPKSGDYYNPAETSEHVRGKQQLFNFFKPIFETVEIEKFLPQINQWPDLMFNRTAIEFQCSPIGTKRLMKRNSGYAKLGIKAWWILGSPYYQRRLTSAYLARFMDYSQHLGFFMSFWRVHNNCLELHYQIREWGGHLRYRKRCFFKYQAFQSFVARHYPDHQLVSNRNFISAVHSDVALSRRRLFHGDPQLITLQSKFNPIHNSLMGCPLIYHWPVFTFPVFKQRVLLWRMWIVILLNQKLYLSEVYHLANGKFGFPLKFCQIRDGNRFYRIAFTNFVKRLCKAGYLTLNKNGKKITRFKRPRWFNSCYDKLVFLKNHL